MCSIDWLSQMVPHMKLQGLNFWFWCGFVWIQLNPQSFLRSLLPVCFQ